MSALGLLRSIATHPANRDRPLAALTRFVRWQIASRMLGATVVHEWVDGARFLVRRGETGLTGNIYTGLHEFADMAFVLHCMRPEDCFFDIGANSGSYTLLACAARGASGLAFEPVPETHRRLVENLRLNHLEGRVQAINCGVGAAAGRMRFSSVQDTMNHALAPGENPEDAIEVPVATLDALAGAQRPTLLKIDVEGYETPVIEGAAGVLAAPSLRAVIMELNGSGSRYGFDEAALLRRMYDFGFETFSYDPERRQLTELDGRNDRSGNTLFVRDRAWIRERLASAPSFELFGRTY